VTNDVLGTFLSDDAWLLFLFAALCASFNGVKVCPFKLNQDEARRGESPRRSRWHVILELRLTEPLSFPVDLRLIHYRIDFNVN
jgi:hypothetical protein